MHKQDIAFLKHVLSKTGILIKLTKNLVTLESNLWTKYLIKNISMRMFALLWHSPLPVRICPIMVDPFLLKCKRNNWMLPLGLKWVNTESNWGPYQTSMMDLYCENSLRLKTRFYFSNKSIVFKYTSTIPQIPLQTPS